MSRLSDALKTAKRRDMDFFYGEGNIRMVSGKYFHFKRVLDDDTIIILTNNITTVKGNPVLVVGDKKAVYLKDWQFRKVSSYQEGINCYAVKLSRKYFKPYEFSFEFDEFLIDPEETFDSLMEVAKEQESVDLKMREGWCH